MKKSIIEGRIYHVLSVVYQLMWLNILVILCSLPIITIGAVSSAAFGTIFSILNDEEDQLARHFFARFRKDFKQATSAWILLIGIGVGTYGVLYAIQGPNTVNFILFMLGMLFTTFLLLSSLYIFPLISLYKSSLPEIIKNSVGLVITNLPYSMLNFFIFTLLVVVFPLYLPRLFFLWLMLGISTQMFLRALSLVKIFGDTTPETEN